MGYREVRALAQLLYHGLTTGLGLQTLGEEYCSMLQVTGNLETSTHKLHELVQALSEQLHSCTRMRFYKHAFVHTRITSTKHAHTHVHSVYYTHIHTLTHTYMHACARTHSCLYICTSPTCTTSDTHPRSACTCNQKFSTNTCRGRWDPQLVT